MMSSGLPVNKRRRLAANSNSTANATNDNDGNDVHEYADGDVPGNELGSSAAGGEQQQPSIDNADNDHDGTLSSTKSDQPILLTMVNDDEDEALRGGVSSSNSSSCSSSSNNNNDASNSSTNPRSSSSHALHSALQYHKTAVWSARENLGLRGGVVPTMTSNNNASALESNTTTTTRPPIPRWRTHQIAEDYISLASSILLPPVHLGSFGYDPAMGRYPIEQITAVGYLTSPLRRPTVVEKWNPYEIALFEGALALHGKNFHTIHKHYVTSKSTKEIIEFYYIWKKTSHGRRWKTSFGEQQQQGGGGEDDGDDDSGSSSDGTSESDSIRRRVRNEDGSTSEKKVVEMNNEKNEGGWKDQKGNNSGSSIHNSSVNVVGVNSVDEGIK